MVNYTTNGVFISPTCVPQNKWLIVLANYMRGFMMDLLEINQNETSSREPPASQQTK